MSLPQAPRLREPSIAFSFTILLLDRELCYALFIFDNRMVRSRTLVQRLRR